MSYRDDLIAREMDGRAAEAEESRAMQEHDERREHHLDMAAQFLIREEGTRAAMLRIFDVHSEAVQSETMQLAAQITQPTKPPDTRDRRPHSRACGIKCTGHGRGCHSNCPTCHGRDEF